MSNIKNINLIPPSPSININSLRPFNEFCITIGMIPSSYKTSLDYEEQLLWFCNYLEETVIPAVNNNGEAVAELQALYEQLRSYIDNYFTNLDVQEEINNKLDAMAEDGTLTNLIKNYVDPLINEQNQIILNFKNQVNNELLLQNNKIDALQSGSPIPVSSTDDMLDTSKVYVLTTTGHWYYYSSGSWNDGGVYQAAEDSNTVDNLRTEVNNLNDLNYEVKQENITYGKFQNIDKLEIIPTDVSFIGGKNFLLVQDGTYESNGITVVVHDNELTINGTATENVQLRIPLITPNIKNNKAYNFILHRLTDNLESLSTGVSIELCTDRIYEKSNSSAHSSFYSGNTLKDVKVFPFTTNYEGFNALRIYTPAGTSFVNNKFNVMLSITNDTEYYFGLLPSEITSDTTLYNIKTTYVQSWNNSNVTSYNEKFINYNNLINKPSLNGVELKNNININDIMLNNNKIVTLFDRITKPFEGEILINGNPNTPNLPNASLYPAFNENDPTQNLNTLFKYSCKMKSRGVYPTFEVICGENNLSPFTCEFILENTTQFEIISWPNSKFKIQVNDEISDTISISSGSNSNVLVTVPNQKNFIKIWFSLDGNFAGIRTDGKISQVPINYLKMCYDGDSILESGHKNITDGFYNGIGPVISQILNVNGIRCAQGGTGYLNNGPISANRQNMVDRFDDTIGDIKPDILVVMAGLNDISLDINDVKTNINAYFEKVKNLNIQYPIFISPFYPYPNPSENENIMAITNYLKQSTLNNNYCFIDIINGKTYDEFGNIITENPAGCIITEENQYIFYKEYYDGTSQDRTHPNTEGNIYIGNYLVNEIYKIINNKKGMFHKQF